MKNKCVSFIVSTICFPIVWSLLDFLYAALIEKKAFQFKIGGNLIIPLVVGAVFGYFTYLRKKEDK